MSDIRGKNGLMMYRKLSVGEWDAATWMTMQEKAERIKTIGSPSSYQKTLEKHQHKHILT